MQLSKFLHNIVCSIFNQKLDDAFRFLHFIVCSKIFHQKVDEGGARISLQFHSFTYCVFYSDEFDMFSVCIMCGGSDVPSVLLPPKPSYKSGFTWTLHSCHQPHCGNCLCSY